MPSISKQHVLAASVAVAVLCAGLFAGSSLAAGAVPAAIVKTETLKTIDGSDADWKDNTAVNTVMSSNGVVATYRLAYDAKNFYALVEVLDGTPLKTSPSTDFQQLFKYDDAIGFCFGPFQGQSSNQRLFVTQIDGKPRALVMRPTWKDKSHQYTYKINTAVTLDDVHELNASTDYQAAFTSTATGYTLELCVPWITLGFTPPDEQEVPFDLQIVGSSNGAANDSVAWWHSQGPEPFTVTDLPTEAALYPQYWGYAHLYAKDPGPQPAPSVPGDEENVFTDPGAGSVAIRFSVTTEKPYASMVIKDANGWIVRELLRAQKFTPNVQQTVFWNGRDRTGQPCAAGNYTYLLGVYKGLTATFAGSVGNSGTPVYPQVDGTGSIGGVHVGPWSIAADGTGIYLLSAMSEGQMPYRKINPTDGTTRWFAAYDHAPQAAAVGGGELFLITGESGVPDAFNYDPANTHLYRLNRDTGAVVSDAAKICNISLGNVKVDGLVVFGNAAYFSDRDGKRIMQLEMSKPSNKPKPFITCTGVPRGLAAYDASSFLACVGSKVVRITTAGKQSDFIATGLVAPYAAAVDAARGAVYVSDPGTPTNPVHQIRKYSLAGAHQSDWGILGGRPLEMSPADPMKLLNVMGLAVDPNTGDVWSVERHTDLRRFIHWKNNGTIIETINGPTHWSPTIVVDHDDASTVYYHSSLDTYVQAKVSFAQYAGDFLKFPNAPAGWGRNACWSVVNTWNPEANAVDDSLLGKFYFLGQPNGAGQKIQWASACKGHVITAANGHRYMFISDLFLSVHASIMLWENNRWVPVATVGDKTWADTVTPDGKIEPNEVAATNPPLNGFAWLDADLTLHGRAGTLKPSSVNSRGVPIYANGKITPLLNAGEPPLASYYEYCYDTYYPSRVDTDGAQYIAGQVGVGAGTGVWDRVSENRLAKLKGGRVEWIIGHHNGAMSRNGDSLLLGQPSGIVDGVVVCPEADHDAAAFTTDGLTLGWIAKDANDHQTLVGPNAIAVEHFSGIFLKDPVTSKRLFITAAGEDIRYLEIKNVFTPNHGVSDITRTTGNVTLTSALSRVPDEVPGQYALRYRTWPTQYAQSYAVCGYDWDFAPDVDALSIKDGAAAIADLRLRRDAGQLCIFADVLDPSVFPDAPANPAENYEHGDGLEILLGPLGPARTAAAAGDTRVFLTAKKDADGKLIGYVYACRPASPDLPASHMADLRALLYTGAFTGAAPTTPLNFRTALAPIPNAVVTVKPRFDKAGYRLEAEIPLALFPELVGTSKSTVNIHRTLAQPASVFTEARWDLPETPLRFNAAVFLGDGKGAARRLPWVADSQVVGNPQAMNPSLWGIANSKVTIDWPAIGGTYVKGHSRYNLYRSDGRDPAKATWVRTVTDALQMVDAPGEGSFYYWLAPVYDTGEGQWIGPVATNENRLVHFWRHEPAKAILLANLEEVEGYIGSSTVVNVLVPAGNKLETIAPQGMTITPCHWQPAQGDTIWSLAITVAADVALGTKGDASLRVGEMWREFTVRAGVAPLRNLALGKLDQSPWTFEIKDDPAKWAKPAPMYAAYGIVNEEAGQPCPCVRMRGGVCKAEYPITPVAEENVDQWTLSGNIQFNMHFSGGQPTQIQLLDDADKPIVTFAHDFQFLQEKLQQILLLNTTVFHNSPGYSDPLVKNWQPFTLTVADGKATLDYAGTYHATVPVPESWRRPRKLVIEVKNASGTTSHPDRQIMVNDLRLVIR